MEWSRAKPTVTGFYGYRYGRPTSIVGISRTDTTIVEVWRSREGTLYISFMNDESGGLKVDTAIGEFCGPIVLPE